MYTQCPDCRIAFRVTAQVLQQAGGRVQCGGCNLAFNAVDYLSESPPGTDAPIDSTVEQPTTDDSITADAGDTAADDVEIENSDDERKQSSEERNTEVLKALDDDVGPEHIRIEQKGVECRVL